MWGKIYFNMNSQGNEQVAYSSKETFDFQVLGNETLIIAGYKAIKNFHFSQVGCKVMA